MPPTRRCRIPKYAFASSRQCVCSREHTRNGANMMCLARRPTSARKKAVAAAVRVVAAGPGAVLNMCFKRFDFPPPLCATFLSLIDSCSSFALAEAAEAADSNFSAILMPFVGKQTSHARPCSFNNGWQDDSNDFFGGPGGGFGGHHHQQHQQQRSSLFTQTDSVVELLTAATHSSQGDGTVAGEPKPRSHGLLLPRSSWDAHTVVGSLLQVQVTLTFPLASFSDPASAARVAPTATLLRPSTSVWP